MIRIPRAKPTSEDCTWHFELEAYRKQWNATTQLMFEIPQLPSSIGSSLPIVIGDGEVNYTWLDCSLHSVWKTPASSLFAHKERERISSTGHYAGDVRRKNVMGSPQTSCDLGNDIAQPGLESLSVRRRYPPL